MQISFKIYDYQLSACSKTTKSNNQPILQNEKLSRQSNQLILQTTHIRLPAAKAAPSVAMVGDLSLAKVDSKANPYTNKATEKKSHAFIGNKRPK